MDFSVFISKNNIVFSTAPSIKIWRFVFIGRKQFPFDRDTPVGLRAIAVPLFEVDSGPEPLGMVEKSIFSLLCRKKVSPPVALVLWEPMKPVAQFHLFLCPYEKVLNCSGSWPPCTKLVPLSPVWGEDSVRMRMEKSGTICQHVGSNLSMLVSFFL